MRLIIVVGLCLLAMCSGRPQDTCDGHDCSTAWHDPTTTTTTTTTPMTHPSTTEGGTTAEGLAAKAGKGLARQGDIRSPLGPIPVPRPLPFPGPIPPIERVAFSVRKAVTTRARGRVEFRTVLTNVGRGWSQGRSVFQTPFSGGYYFSFHAVAEKSEDFTMGLMRNRVYQVTAYGTSGDYQHGSNSVFLELRRGDQVYLEIQEGEIYEHPGDEAYTSFTGFMVYQN
ncbi:complement C1q-like protein 4 [Eriocheir sinensis]|uniref:complement C1q-like protein 4 n=1 Tax=Eriocheir sinensis TaxID=95602 RepID=UPI0021C592A7|nr:complement C1q-like protein 4 [Eriocheir sinensis]